MAWSSAACVLGGVRLISSASRMFAKIGPGRKRNARRPASGSSRTFVPVMSDGMRSGVNWTRLNPTSRILRDRADHERLGQARHAHQQHVAPREDGREDLLDHLALADHHLAQLDDHLVALVAEFIEELRDAVAGRRHGLIPLPSARRRRKERDLPARSTPGAGFIANFIGHATPARPRVARTTIVGAARTSIQARPLQRPPRHFGQPSLRAKRDAASATEAPPYW